MYRSLMFIVPSMVIALAAAPASAQTGAVTSDVAEGQRLATNICSACHVVSRSQPDAPMLRPPAPSFASIAKKKGVTAESLKHFIGSTHPTSKSPSEMPNPQLLDDQTAKVIAYILSLNGRN